MIVSPSTRLYCSQMSNHNNHATHKIDIAKVDSELINLENNEFDCHMHEAIVVNNRFKDNFNELINLPFLFIQSFVSDTLIALKQGFKDIQRTPIENPISEPIYDKHQGNFEKILFMGIDTVLRISFLNICANLISQSIPGTAAMRFPGMATDATVEKIMEQVINTTAFQNRTCSEKYLAAAFNETTLISRLGMLPGCLNLNNFFNNVIVTAIGFVSYISGITVNSINLKKLIEQDKDIKNIITLFSELEYLIKKEEQLNSLIESHGEIDKIESQKIKIENTKEELMNIQKNVKLSEYAYGLSLGASILRPFFQTSSFTLSMVLTDTFPNVSKKLALVCNGSSLPLDSLEGIGLCVASRDIFQDISNKLTPEFIDNNMKTFRAMNNQNDNNSDEWEKKINEMENQLYNYIEKYSNPLSNIKSPKVKDRVLVYNKFIVLIRAIGYLVSAACSTAASIVHSKVGETNTYHFIINANTGSGALSMFATLVGTVFMGIIKKGGKNNNPSIEYKLNSLDDEAIKLTCTIQNEQIRETII